MNDITKHYRFQRILLEAAQYRILRDIFEAAEKAHEAENEIGDAKERPHPELIANGAA